MYLLAIASAFADTPVALVTTSAPGVAAAVPVSTQAGFNVPVDMSDPIVAVGAWVVAFVLNLALKKYGTGVKGRNLRRLRHAIPILSVAIATGMRAGYGAVAGEAFSGTTVIRASAAGAFAVLGHSQGSELWKAAFGTTDEELKSPTAAAGPQEPRDPPTDPPVSSTPLGEAP